MKNSAPQMQLQAKILPRTRLDQALLSRGLVQSRSQAREAILRGVILVDGKMIDRPAALVSEAQSISRAVSEEVYVSRGGLKLAAGLNQFGYDPAGRIGLDIGASTGGFTQVLLARGAIRVYALDVGHGQLHERLVGDPRVVNLEGVNARDLSSLDLPSDISCLTADVSFISLRLALPHGLGRVAGSGFAILLFKPQFELGRAALGKGGIVRDAAAARTGAEEFAGWLEAHPGWRVDGILPSPILGGDGNLEFLIGAHHG